MEIDELKIAAVESMKRRDWWRDDVDLQLNTRKTCGRTLELAADIKDFTGSQEDVREIARQLTKLAKNGDPDFSWFWRTARKAKFAEYLGGSPENRGVDEHGWSLPPGYLG